MERKRKNMETSIVKSNVPTPKEPEFSSEKKSKLLTKKISEKNGNSHHSLPVVISRLHQI